MDTVDYYKTQRKEEHVPAQRRHVIYHDSMNLVHITSFEERVLCGELLNLSCNEIFTFRGLDQMALIMEDIMDKTKMPRAFFSHRYLGKKPYMFEYIHSEDLVRVLERTGVSAMPSFRIDFSIRCGYRHHGSMQGELTVMQRKSYKKIYFRSALEMIRMIYEQFEQRD